MASCLCVAIIRPIQVRWDHTDVVCTILLVIKSALHLTHSLCVGVALIGRVRWSLMERSLFDRVLFNHVGVDASAKDTHQSLDTREVRAFDDIVVYCHVVLEELHLVVHIGEQAAHSRCKVYDYRWLDPLEQCLCLAPVCQVCILPLCIVEVCTIALQESSKQLHKAFSVLLIFEALLSLLSRQCGGCGTVSYQLLDAVTDHAIGSSDQDELLVLLVCSLRVFCLYHVLNFKRVGFKA